MSDPGFHVRKTNRPTVFEAMQAHYAARHRVWAKVPKGAGAIERYLHLPPAPPPWHLRLEAAALAVPIEARILVGGIVLAGVALSLCWRFA